MSGYIYAFLKFEKGKYRKLSSFAANKAKRLLIPYVFALIVWVAPWHWFYFHSSMSDFIKKYVLGCNPSQLWFLLMLFFVFIIAYFVGGMIKSRPLLGLVLSLVLYGIGVVGQSLIGNYYQIFTACTYFIFFTVGMLFRCYGTEKLKQIPIIVYVIVDIVLFLISNIITDIDITAIKVLNLGILLVLHIVGAIMAFTVLLKITKRLTGKQEETIKTTGYISSWFTTISLSICFISK